PAPAKAETMPPAPAVALPPKTLSFGVGVRVGGGIQTTTAATSSDSLGIQSLDVRPYISGQVHPLLKFEGNLDLNNVDQSRIRVLSAVAKFELDDLFNVWFGRFLPPSDRANLSGPYFQNAWNYPADVNGYPSIYAGRADGAAIWGQLEKRLPWADTLTLEGAYYNFNEGAQGWSWYALASYLFAPKVGFGQVQPMARWQQLTPTVGGDPTRVFDAGLNYIIDGHSTRIAF